MDTKDTLGLISATVAVSAFTFNYITYRLKLKADQANNATKLHDKWWSSEFLVSRKNVFEVVKDWQLEESKRTKSNKFIEYYSSAKREYTPDEIDDFAKIVFFFSDLNIYIDEKLVDIKLVHRLFGDSQYAYFRGLISAAREARSASKEFDAEKTKTIRWITETEALEKKFDHFKKQQKKKRLFFR